ncbi:MAG: YitT family protein [Clostridia bacterium]|nr:YitT family protein [Clostridia bacterium]
MGEQIQKFKEKVQTRENRLKNEQVKLFKWGGYKFAKCILGVFLYSLAVNLFVVPNHLYTGGILGLAQILRTIIVSQFNINTSIDISSIIYYLINIPLLIIGYKKISKTFIVRTIFTVTLNTIFLMVLPIPKEPLINDLMASTLIGGILCGIGIGMILSTGSSSGGTDIIGILINKKKDRISVGSIGLSFNIMIYSICGLNYGIATMLYSIIFASFETIMLDRTHTQNIKSETIIFTKQEPDKLIHFINYELKRGTTYWEATGGYTNTKTYIVYTVLSKYERMRLERHMKEFDENAFLVGDDGVAVKGNFGKYLI